jgi:hypothetical protein
MKGLAAIARREIVQHRDFILGALFAGILAAGAPLLPFVGGPAREIREISAAFAALALAAGVSIALGSSTLAREIASRRIGFDFARPVPAAGIWAGKLGGAAAVTAAVAFAATFPTLLVNRGIVSREIGLILISGLVLTIALLLPMAHAAGIVFRSRSPWLAVDLVLLVVTAGIVALTARLLLHEMAVAAASRGLLALGAFVLAAVIGAGFAALSRGRTDIQAAHRAFSRVFWPAALAAAALFAAYAGWIVSIEPRDLAGIRAVPAPRGDWTRISGSAPGRGDYEPLFLFQTSTGRSLRLKAGYWNAGTWNPLLFSADGRVAVWLEGGYRVPPLSVMGLPELVASPFQPMQYYRLALDEPSARPQATGILLSSFPRAWAVSGDGNLIAVASAGGGVRNLVSVHEVSTGRLLASVAMPPQIRVRIAFPTQGHLRLYAEESSEAGAANDVSRQIVIYDFDIAGKALTRVGGTETFRGWLVLRRSSDGSRFLVIDPRGKTITLHEDPSGRRLAVLSSGETWNRGAVFLSDGRIASTEGNASGTRVRVFSADGDEQKMIPIRAGPGRRLGLGGEISAGMLVVSSRQEKSDWKDSEIFLADTRTGESRPVAQHLVPLTGLAWQIRDDPESWPAAGSEATKLFYGAGGSLIHFDPSTGEQRVILAGRPSS